MSRLHTPLHMVLLKSTYNDNPKTAFAIVKLLCEAGAQVDARTRQGMSPLCLAVMYASADVVDYLLNGRCGGSVADFNLATMYRGE